MEPVVSLFQDMRSGHTPQEARVQLPCAHVRRYRVLRQFHRQGDLRQRALFQQGKLRTGQLEISFDIDPTGQREIYLILTLQDSVRYRLILTLQHIVRYALILRM